MAEPRLEDRDAKFLELRSPIFYRDFCRSIAALLPEHHSRTLSKIRQKQFGLSICGIRRCWGGHSQIDRDERAAFFGKTQSQPSMQASPAGETYSKRADSRATCARGNCARDWIRFGASDARSATLSRRELLRASHIRAFGQPATMSSGLILTMGYCSRSAMTWRSIIS